MGSGSQESEGEKRTGRQLVRNGGFNVMGFIANSLILVVSAPLLLRYLGEEEFGLYAILSSMMGTLGLLDLGLGAAATKFVAQYRALEDRDATAEVLGAITIIYLAIGLVAGATLFLFTAPLTHLFNLGSDLSQIAMACFRLMPLYLVFTFLNNIFIGSIKSCMRYDLSNFIIVASKYINLIGIIYISFIGYGCYYIMCFSIMIYFISFGLSFYIYLRTLHMKPPTVVHSWHRIREVLGFSIFVEITNIGSSLLAQGDQLVIGAMLGPVAAGHYALCKRASVMLFSLAGALSHVVMPMISAEYAIRGVLAIKGVLPKTLRVVTVSVLSVAFIAVISARLWLNLWVGSTVAAVILTPTQLMLVIYSLAALNAPGYYIANGIGKPQINALWGAIGGVAVVLAALFCVPRWGLVGAALANAPYLLAGGTTVWLVLVSTSKQRLRTETYA